MGLLTTENYQKGLLVDEELMGGVTEAPEQPGSYLAFVLRHTTGEYLGYETYSALEPALDAINQVKRPWVYEKSGGCGEAACGDGGPCQGKNCSLYKSDDCKKHEAGCEPSQS
jgi:hypothetical protein